MLPRRLLIPSLLGASFLLAACGGSSGGSPPRGQIPALVSAVFTGSSTSDNTPDPGDTLTLFFTQPVVVVAGRIIDDSVLELSAGSLGTGLAAPARIDDRTLRVTLGTGTTFTVGTDTVSFIEGQGSITDSFGQEIDFSQTPAVQLSDGQRPTVTSLTVNAIPSELNGSGSAGGTLQVPRTGFTIDAEYNDGMGTIDTSGFVITSDIDVRSGGTIFPAGQNLFGTFAQTSVTGTECTLTASSSLLFNEGDHTLSFVVRDNSGLLSAPSTFLFRVRNPSPTDRPFENGQRWFLDLTRDLETLTSSASSGSLVIINAPIPGENGTADLLEDLLILGLRSTTPIANVSPPRDSNDVTFDLLKAAITTNLTGFFSDTSVEFTFDDPGDFPSARPFVDYNAATHSRMAIGSSATINGTLGVALFDPNNRTQDNNTLDEGTHGGVQLSSRLGVFIHTMIAADINRLGSGLRADFDDLIRFRGTPVGEDSGDGTRLQNILANTSGDARQTAIKNAVDKLGRFIAVIVAHECGHSIGLVQDGAMPGGLYGGSSSFPGSSSGHLDLSSTMIFPSSATEIMSPAVSYERSVDAGTNFTRSSRPT